MKVYVTFRRMEPSDALKNYAADKVRRTLNKHIKLEADAQITLSIDKFRHIASFLINYNGLSIKSEEVSADMYSSIDDAVRKLDRQLRRYKGKLRKHQPSAGRNTLFHHTILSPPLEEETTDGVDVIYDEEMAEIEQAQASVEEALAASRELPSLEIEDDPYPTHPLVAVQEASNETPPSNGRVHVLKREVRQARPMKIDEAVMQLDLRQNDFIVFTNARTERINILYRRDDGNFGLIDAQTEAE